MLKQQPYNKGNVICLLKKWLGIVLYVSIVLEMIFFPKWENFVGCLMQIVVWLIFRGFFLKQKLILEHPFSFLAFLSLFLARYIPLPATLLEGKPITYGFEVPFETFFFETIMFIVASMAFYAAINRKRSNNAIQNLLYRLKFFKTDPVTLWILGGIGLAIRIQQLTVANEVEFGDVNNKFLAGLVYLQYAPIIMLFPTLSGISYQRRRIKFVILYTSLIFVVSFATNSRQAMLYPILSIVLLFFFYVLKHNKSLFTLFTPKKMIIVGLVLVFGLSFISDISLAMLSNRSGRSDISRTELFDRTIETLQDPVLMDQLRSLSLEENTGIISYEEGWDERYLGNFMLNRYGNIRVSDQTLYYANKIGYGNMKMQESFYEKALAIFPLPFLSFFNIEVDKEQLLYSPGDMLLDIGGGGNFVLGGFRVTSLVADGLATFDYWCFPILFVLFYLSFRLLDCFVYFKKSTTVYSTLGLINVFGFLGMFRNSIGCIVLLSYILRGFWQQCFTFWIVVYLIQLIPFKKRKHLN